MAEPISAGVVDVALSAWYGRFDWARSFCAGDPRLIASVEAGMRRAIEAADLYRTLSEPARD